MRFAGELNDWQNTRNKAEADQDHFVELFAIATVPRANKNAKRFSAKLKSALKQGYDINYMLPDDATNPVHT